MLRRGIAPFRLRASRVRPGNTTAFSHREQREKRQKTGNFIAQLNADIALK
jgi:hypothetical protein